MGGLDIYAEYLLMSQYCWDWGGGGGGGLLDILKASLASCFMTYFYFEKDGSLSLEIRECGDLFMRSSINNRKGN